MNQIQDVAGKCPQTLHFLTYTVIAGGFWRIHEMYGDQYHTYKKIEERLESTEYVK